MRKKQSFMPAVAMLVFGLGIAWGTVATADLDPSSLVGGFCVENEKCETTIEPDCQGTNCPSGTTHSECITEGENPTEVCTINGNCNSTAGCNSHGDCTCDEG